MSYVINFENKEDIPFCIICQESILESATPEIISNELCSCNFHYHQLCYEKWINLVKQKQCLMCRKDISMNFLYTSPFDASNNITTVQRRAPFINIALMSPRTRYRYGIPFMYQPRRVNIIDRIFNAIICVDDPNEQNPLVDWVYHNQDSCVMSVVTIFCFSSLVVVIICVGLFVL